MNSTELRLPSLNGINRNNVGIVLPRARDTLTEFTLSSYKEQHSHHSQRHPQLREAVSKSEYNESFGRYYIIDYHDYPSWDIAESLVTNNQSSEPTMNFAS